MQTPYIGGANQSPTDARDFLTTAFLPAAAALPPDLDLRPCLPPVRNQGQEGTCQSFAGVGLMGYAEATHSPALSRDLSPRWLYQHAHALMPPPGGAEGAYLRCVMATLLNVGVCLEADQPYTAGFPTVASADAPTHAAQNRIGSYAATALDPPTVKQALFYHGPQAVAANVDDGFCHPAASRAIIIPGGIQRGGHAFLLVGWSDKMQCWLVRNSWGPEWGEGGYAWLPWSYPLWEAWAATPALLPDGSHPAPPTLSWWDRTFPWLQGLGL